MEKADTARFPQRREPHTLNTQEQATEARMLQIHSLQAKRTSEDLGQKSLMARRAGIATGHLRVMELAEQRILMLLVLEPVMVSLRLVRASTAAGMVRHIMTAPRHKNYHLPISTPITPTRHHLPPRQPTDTMLQQRKLHIPPTPRPRVRGTSLRHTNHKS